MKSNVALPKQTSRSVRDVRHVQMDIAVRDSTLKGIIHEHNDWMMTTYYYDKSYTAGPDSPLRRVQNLPEELLHMRPIGVQVGFEPKDSIIFKGSQTNQVSGQLNGPADNPKSSCLGCHGTAGTKIPMAPGTMKNTDYTGKVRNSTHLDFSQQVALAKRNYETRARRR